MARGTFFFVALSAAIVGGTAAAAATATDAASPASQSASAASTPAAPVTTRARVVSVEREGGRGGAALVRLQLLPRAKLPFTTLAFRVADPTLLAGIFKGAWVKFTARRVEGENTLTSIHVVEECKRFQPCD